MKRFVFAIAGASCAPVGLRVLGELAKRHEVHLVISSQAFMIIREESGVDWQGGGAGEVQARVREWAGSEAVYVHDERDLAAPVSSGSFLTDGMFIVPCSLRTVAAVASGLSDNLIVRAADVTIKEGRRLVISPREMPFSAIHLENMLKLARLGVTIAPPVLGFYHGPRDINDLVDFAAGKILDAMGVKHSLFRRWGSSSMSNS